MMAADPQIVSPFYNIPSELRSLQAWCCWRYQITPYGKTKVPYNPLTGRNAASNDPSTWCSFEQALAAVGSYDGIGFFFDKSFGYVGIDLDHTEDEKLLERHATIKLHSLSYAEYSPSGKGLHIICKGSIPRGVKSASKKIEMYDTGRFFTMTGNVYRNSLPTDEQAMLDFLFASISRVKDVEGLAVSQLDQPEIDDDVTIYNRASTASNGDKFLKLWNGEFSGLYGSASEADLALINIIAFYSRNFAQTERIFKFSVLGKREKAQRKDYVKPMIEKAFDRMPPTIEALMSMSSDFNKLLLSQKEAAESNSTSAPLAVSSHQSAASAAPGKGDNQVPPSKRYNFTPPQTSPEWVLNPPPGIIRDAAAFIHAAAYHPVKEIALAGAVGLMAGICGRSFNVRGTGLNLYIAMLAQTGRGKEAISSGIGAIHNSICMSNTLAHDKIVGPGDFASGQGLQRHLNSNPCFVSVIGEFDNFIAKMHSPRASDVAVALKQSILDCYNKSGEGNSFRGVAYSDKKNNIDPVASPAFSFIGECTVNGMKEIVNEKMIQSGMLPRILTFVYDGKRHYENESPLKIQNESTGLIQKLVVLFGTTLQINAQNKPINLEFTEEAELYRKGMSRFVTDYMNAHSDDSVLEQLYNRAAQNVMRLAALCSIEVVNGHVNMMGKIKIEHMMWAASVVWSSIEFWSKCFGNNEVGDQSNDIAQLRDLKTYLEKWSSLDIKRKKQFNVTDGMINDGVIPMKYLQQNLWNKASFKHAHMMKGDIFKKTIQTLLDNGEVISIKDKKTGLNKYGSTQEGFIIISPG